MAETTIFQLPVIKDFILPFILVFAIIFAILEKTKVLGSDKHQINAIVAGVIGFIFIGFTSPKEFVSNLILFLTLGLIVIFVIMLLWGFLVSDEPKLSGKGLRWVVGIVLIIAVIIGVLWASGMELGALDYFFNQSWSSSLWTNVLFVIVAGAAIAVILATGGSGGKKDK